MTLLRLTCRPQRLGLAPLVLTAALCFCAVMPVASAHPLGNFTVNHFCRVEVGAERVRVRYVVDMAEIPTVQELQAVDVDGNGSYSEEELHAYLAPVAQRYAQNLWLVVDGVRIPLEVFVKKLSTPAGAGGLPTLRVECDLEGALPGAAEGDALRTLRFEDMNHRGRVGWHELVVTPGPGVTVFNCSAYGSGVTDELTAYPAEGSGAPLDERAAELSFTRGAPPAGSTALVSRDGRTVSVVRDRFAELIAQPELTPGVAFLALLAAAGLGGLHALSPGHGKAVVGAYLVGSHGTPRHAALLGLMVTVTHTSSVFALGIATLFASRYVLPERLLPALSLASGALVLAVGLRLLVSRLRSALSESLHRHPDLHTHDHSHEHAHTHEHDRSDTHEHLRANVQPNAHDHSRRQRHIEGAGHVHSHGGRAHKHAVPGANDAPVSWRSLLALGVSGGLLPCPSALIVMLSAIALHRVGFGLLLIVAFSLGLAAVLTCVGLAFVYAGRLMKSSALSSGPLSRALPILSALVVTCIGVAICYGALTQAGFSFK